jgi:hypothetical protein
MEIKKSSLSLIIVIVIITVGIALSNIFTNDGIVRNIVNGN